MTFAPECCWPIEARATFWAIFENFSWSPLCTFSENAGFGWPSEDCHNLAIRALLEPLFALKSFPVLAVYVHTSWRIMPFDLEFFGAFQARVLFGWFLKNFPSSPTCTFSENAGLGWPCKNCHNSAIRALLEPPSAPKSFPLFEL